MTLPLTIPSEVPEQPAMDYAFLRSAGIQVLERLGSRLWTDFNAHDPGVTILEQVCYALTDLGYRINYDMKDLLVSGQDDPYRSLHSPAEVLTTNPVTLTDLRKLLIDVPGVKNAWFEPVDQSQPELLYDPEEHSLFLETNVPQPAQRTPVSIRGVYSVLIEAGDDSGLHPADFMPEVNRRLQSCRGLGEDFVAPTILPGQAIVINATIEVGMVENPDSLLLAISRTLANAISPGIHFYTLSEILARGKRMDEIMDGPALQHGFIDDEELAQLDRKVGLRVSDLIQEILKVPGTVAVSSINIASDGLPHEDWYLSLDPLRTPFLDLSQSLIQLTRSGIQVQPTAPRVDAALLRLEPAAGNTPLPENQRDIHLPRGRDRKIGQYYSIQHQFPATYGIGGLGLPDSASLQRKAQANQLKAYLMFFDQLLANYFAQLANAKELFSFYSSEPRTYFSQPVSAAGLKLEEILGNDWDAYTAAVQDLTDASALGVPKVDWDQPANAERKNRFLNHLLARFAEQFTDYSLFAYGNIRVPDLIEDKNAFLRDYQTIGARRGTGFNYAQPAWGTDNISGLEKRISRKLGLSTDQVSDLNGLQPGDEGGFHMIEHILLRPSLADRQQWAQATAGADWQAAAFMAQPDSQDPYSHQLSFIFPAWVTRLADPGFVELIEKTLREETPAHLRAYLHWLDQGQMLNFEMAYRAWLENAIAGHLWDPKDVAPDDTAQHMIQIRLRDARDQMVQILGLGTPYPLRDLILVYPPTVAYNSPASIQILDGQSDVHYQLCDEDGNPIVENGSTFEVQPGAGTAEDGVRLPTPVITKDITFTILAVRDGVDGGDPLETYLNQTVSIKAGIDTGLQVAFQPGIGQIAAGSQITINYDDQVTVTVSRSQEGISYQLVTGPNEKRVILSPAVKGNQDTLTIETSARFGEDTLINVLAYRTADPGTSAILDTALSIMVRPDPAVRISTPGQIIDYNTATTIQLTAAQTSTEYRLYKRELSPSDYLPGQAEGSLVIQIGKNQYVFVNAPEKVATWDASSGLTLVGVFSAGGANLSASTGNLLEDTLFIIQATKIANRETFQLEQAAVVLVRPDPAPLVASQVAAVAAGAAGVVTVSNGQKGVAYQLRLDSDNSPINPPGYYLADRGIETVRLEVDFVVESPGDPVILLSTAPITKATTFNVLATKMLSGVSTELTGKASIGISSEAAG